MNPDAKMKGNPCAALVPVAMPEKYAVPNAPESDNIITANEIDNLLMLFCSINAAIEIRNAPVSGEGNNSAGRR